MHATPQRLHLEEPRQLPSLRAVPPGPKLGQRMMRFFRLLRLAFWRAFVHDAFATAKASAYSSILTFFPVLVIVGSVLANWRKGAPYLREISYALGSILPAGGNTALSYLKGAAKHPVGFLITTSVITSVDRLRRHDLLDGRLPPLLRTARRPGAWSRSASSHSCS